MANIGVCDVGCVCTSLLIPLARPHSNQRSVKLTKTVPGLGEELTTCQEGGQQVASVS